MSMLEPVANDFFSLHDFRRRVFDMYRERDTALLAGDDPAAVWERYRARRNELFATHPQSAYDAEQRKSFEGLDYFPYDASCCVEASLHTDVESQRLLIETSGDGVIPLEKVGRLRFSLGDVHGELSLYWVEVYGGGLFLPFRDATAPEETYGGGRYLFDSVKGSDFLELPAHGGVARMLLDFNYAYNPSCAFNFRWSCPLAPQENHLPFPIRAGEKKPR